MPDRPCPPITAPRPDITRPPARPEPAPAPAPAPATLPDEAEQARRFTQARRIRTREVLEDYAELIADLIARTGEARAIDIARRLGVSHVSAGKAIARLQREGLATARPYRGVFLTEQGQALAERVRARHQLVVQLLLALGVPAAAAEADAEGIEHHVSAETLAAFARFLAAGTAAGAATAPGAVAVAPGTAD